MTRTDAALHFTKMHGCGNDYIYVDCFEGMPKDPAGLAVRLSDRHFGIGGDGLVLICPSASADCRMRMFNADGSEGNMCGNAIRCVGKYMHDRRQFPDSSMNIETKSGLRRLRLFAADGRPARTGAPVASAEVAMGRAEFLPERLPVLLPGDRIVDREIRLAALPDRTFRVTCVSMGNPHCVVFGGPPEKIALETLGPAFEKDPLFPERVNTEFVQVLDENTLVMRVWERGSGETWACGTGACAAAAAACANGYCKPDTDIAVRLRGGTLTIRVAADRAVTMTGPAAFVFEGEVAL